MTLNSWFDEYTRSYFEGRYLSLDHLLPVMQNLDSSVLISELGVSENGLPIHSLTLGKGPEVIFGWSQMHGNESTTTRAIFDLIHFLTQSNIYQEEILEILNEFTLVFIPMLNPDGALLYTRENINKVDLNRDAQDQTQSESRVLRNAYEEIKPDLCLNLHDQRSIYGLDSGKPAIISFLAPAMDEEKSITAGRKQAMETIVRMNKRLQQWIPGCVGCYDDSFNINCVGDTFQNLGTPTILFEAGHYPGDYQRMGTRRYIFFALLEMLGFFGAEEQAGSWKDYTSIPENRENYNDICVKNVRIKDYKSPVSLYIQYEEVLNEGKIDFLPVLQRIEEIETGFAHLYVDCNGAEVLINSHENVFVNDKIATIVDKNDEKHRFFSQS